MTSPKMLIADTFSTDGLERAAAVRYLRQQVNEVRKLVITSLHAGLPLSVP